MNSREEFLQGLASLRAAIITRDCQIRANPLPHLKAMEKRCAELEDLFNKIDYALSPNMVFDTWDTLCDKDVIQRPTDIQGEALIRCNAALKVISDYNKGES
ncbi:MAG: hypothetical protein COA47_10300 [Robiginitomaculum sp.]|nr:MAG: hypothetical protein COA47_10300 [Robiginitomaculum sp.]